MGGTAVRRTVVALAFGAALLCGAGSVLLGTCGPFTDTANDVFCPFVLEIFYVGITTGTTPTTYDPSGNVTRLQMSAFLSRGVGAALRRGSRAAALGRFWRDTGQLAVTTVGAQPFFARSDGADVWVGNHLGFSVSRVRVSDGKLLENWSVGTPPTGIVVAMGRVVVASDLTPNARLYSIDPSLPAGAATTVATNLGPAVQSLTFDGASFWSANFGIPPGPGGGSVSRITPGAPPWTVTTITSGFSNPDGIEYDGSNVWVTDVTAGTLLRLAGTGAVLQTVTVQNSPAMLVFDGANLWVPNAGSNSISVVRASTGSVLATLTGNGLNAPFAAAFNGEVVAVTNVLGSASVSAWNAQNLAPLGTISLTFGPELAAPAQSSSGAHGICSTGDGRFAAMDDIVDVMRWFGFPI
ncbi:MAG TPA: hypothetical protein VKH43_03345 [Thermoanaerobaculia bacterium]|nr:hypothetical protein [Thermoanaerobaculia bacterium]